MQVLGWDSSGTIVFNDVGCSQNVALDYGGCFYSAGRGIVNDGTVMHGNEADDGGCLCAFGADIEVFGGDFMCRSTAEGGFLNAKSSSSVKITGGLIAGNVAETRGGAIHCGENGGSTLTIEGGTFTNNLAWESGGAVAARDSLSAVEITGGTFYNNTAKLYGGFVYVDEGASLNCQAITARGNKAGDQGGGIYARDATSINSSCHLIGNESPQGAALHLTGSSGVMLQNHTVTDNVASSGSVLYMTESSVVAIGVSFTSSVALQEDSSNRAVQSDGSSALTAQECLFDGWIGDTVIYHRSPNSDSLILDSCDFSGSSAMAAVFSLNSDAKIRNAVVSDLTFANAGALSNSLALVNRVVDCSDSTVCGIGDCVNSTLGVLCECLDDDSCLDDGSEVSLGVKTYPASETYSPGTVSFKLIVSSARGGTTHTIWELEYEADDLVLDVAPSSGVLPPGGNLTVVVTGTPKGQDVGGDLVSRFNLTSVGSAGSNSTGTVLLEVMSTFYLCSAFEYAVPLANKTNGVSCEQCISINGGEGVDCKRPGATLASLPIRQGHWRSSRDSRVVHECLHKKACAGRTKLSSADDYCHAGYKGPYCAVCSDGYGRGVGNTCHFCDSTKGHVLIAAGALAAAVIVFVVLLAVVFLIGGLNAVDIVYQSVTRKRSKAGKASQVGSVPESRSQESRYPTRNFGVDYTSGTIAPALDFGWELKRGASECHTRNGSLASTTSSRAPILFEQGACIRPSDAAVGVGTSVQLSDPTGRRNAHAGTSVVGRSWMSTPVDAGADGVQYDRKAGLETNTGGNSKPRGLGVRVKWWALGLPLYKFKILLVVWQILSGITSITGVEFPASYSTFLSWINVVNLDIGQLFSVSCVLPSVNFYARLLTTTLTPLVLAAVLLLTYQFAKYCADIGSAGVMEKKAAWSRHVAAGLLLTFLVFTPASTLVFEIFDCDDAVGGGETYLRADYSLSCDTNLHMWFTGYAMIMVLVYPIGIPALYAAILWKQRELLNPRIHAVTQSEPGIAGGAAATTDSKKGAGIHISMFSSTSKDQAKDTLSRLDLQEYHHRVRDRREHPELAPSMFLWKDFGPGLFYYEVIECGRRMLLTGVLVFVAPHSSTQAATACIFAFVGLLGFELMRPHLDLTDAWLYRLGCVVIFMSNFLGLLIKVDAAGVESRSALGGLLVAVNVLLVFAVLVTAIVDAKQSIGDSGDDDGACAIARTMLTAGQDPSNTVQVTRKGAATISAGRPSTKTSLNSRGPPVI